jgi:hypothetical protein
MCAPDVSLPISTRDLSSLRSLEGSTIPQRSSFSISGGRGYTVEPTIMPGWKEATAVQKVSSDTYTATLHDGWCIGSG